jgi:hypothetical protein
MRLVFGLSRLPAPPTAAVGSLSVRPPLAPLLRVKTVATEITVDFTHREQVR